MREHGLAGAVIAGCLLAMGGCATIPKDALVLSPDSLERRQLQTRRIEGIGEKELLSAAAGVLQDLGFNIDESETRLGVIVASKDRSAITGSQITGAVLLALLGAYHAVDKTQKIRVSLVTRPAVAADGAALTDSHLLRITIQRVVRDTQGQVTRIESIEEPAIYQEFFEKLSKSVFLEVQQI
ncbi:MAG: hypothetical protein EXR87_01790 [Gammaproteobacteria bacterium]|nr:hypothetical protein [Gammaproteobacteria bacterium]